MILNRLLFGQKMEIPIYRGRKSRIMAEFWSLKISFLVIREFMSARHQTSLEKVGQLPSLKSLVSLKNHHIDTSLIPM